MSTDGIRRRVAAVDLGAESGRVAVVSYDGTRLHVEVAHRFTHVASVQDGLLRWDLDHIWTEVQRGLVSPPPARPGGASDA